jgi:zinc transport system substrate-binding protein
MRISKLAIILLLLIPSVIGCSSSNDFTVEDKVNVVTSFYPLYDFVTKIGGEHVNVINLVPTGVEPHEWSPKPRDMSNITKADVFIYNGAGFEGWAEDFLDSLTKESKLLVVEAIHDVDLIHTGNKAHGQSDEHEANDQHDHGDVDPHAWIRPLQAIVMTRTIKDYLIEADPTHQADYEANYAEIANRLQELHEQLTQIVSQSPKREIVVSHESFGYIARDYGITQLGVMGLSPDAEPTVRKLNEITKFAKEHNIQYILFEDLVSPKLAETLAESLNIQTLILSPIEGLTEDQKKAKEDYFSIMANNLTTLKKALQ